jgi:hypothetical protein
MMAALQKEGGTPIYTEFTGRGHDFWIKAFFTPGLIDWLMKQHRVPSPA